MVKGTTESGFSFEIDENCFDDMELLDKLISADAGNYMALTSVLSAILGDDQKKELYEHVRTKEGRVPITAVTAEVQEIFQAAGKAAKNSRTSPT